MKFDVEVKSVMTLEIKPGKDTPIINEVRIEFDVVHESGKDMRTPFVNEEGSANRTGVEMISQALIHGLNSNIQHAHSTGLFDSAEHLRYIIGELERAFVCVVSTEELEIPE